MISKASTISCLRHLQVRWAYSSSGVVGTDAWIDFFKEAYNFSPGIGGLCYLGLGIGFFIATMFGAKIGDQIYASVSDPLTA